MARPAGRAGGGTCRAYNAALVSELVAEAKFEALHAGGTGQTGPNFRFRGAGKLEKGQTGRVVHTP